jgi:small subunit ribosomal protein S20
MANIASQIKRNRQSERRRLDNKSVRSAVKTAMKKFRTAAETGERESAAELYRAAARSLDKAASKGVVHANYAANKKAKMAKQLGTLS